MVTKTDYRFLHTLENMGPSPEPNLTVLYSPNLPTAFKKYAAKISIDTSSIQYENDEVMKPEWGDDYSICCCVSATKTGKEIQLFGARANLAKTLLYAFNGGFDEKHRIQCGPAMQRITSEYADYDEVIEKFDWWMDWLADIYVNVLNLIHYMHDKYYYEAAEMALINNDCERSFATGIAGFSHVVDSLSAIKYVHGLMKSQPGCLEPSLIKSAAVTHTVTPSQVPLFLQLLPTLFTERRQAQHQTDVKHTPLLPQVLHRPMVQSRMVFWLP